MNTNLIFFVSLLVPIACVFVAWLLLTSDGTFKKLSRIAAWIVIAYGALFVFFSIQRLYGNG